MPECPPDELLHQLLSDGFSGADAVALTRHVEHCSRCRIILDQASDDADLRSWKAALADCRSAVDGQHPADLIDRILSSRPAAITDVADSSTPRRWETVRAFALNAGFRLGSFELLEELGRGGMGVVYKARDNELDRIVAIKIVPIGDADEKTRSRFVREAQAAAKVKHPHVVTIHSVDTADDGSPYLVMEYVKGKTFQLLLREHALPFQTSAELLSQAARGLQAIHDVQLVHCDVKPSNIILEQLQATGSLSHGKPATETDASSYRAKIADFGLARAFAIERKLTVEGTVGGTPNYMSPEQLRENGTVSPASDVYSLGVTLYEALTGSVPFSGTPQVVMRQIEHVDPRSPRTLNPSIPRDLENICLKAMDKDHRRRYATTTEFADDLQRWLRHEPVLARPAGAMERAWRWCHRNPRIALLTVAVCSLLIFATLGSVTAAIWISIEQGRTRQEQVAARKAELEARRSANAAKAAQALAESHARRSREQRDLALAAHVQLVAGVHDRLADTPGTLALRKELLETAVVGLERIVGDSSGADDADHTLFLAHQRLGEAYLTLGRLDDSRRQLELARDVAKSIGERDPASEWGRKDLTAALTSLAEFHMKGLEYKKAQEGLKSALESYYGMGSTETSDPDHALRGIRILSDLGNVSLRLAAVDEGEHYFQEALKLAKQLPEQGQVSSQARRVTESVLRHLGDVALLRGQLGKGVDYYRQAFHSAEETGLAGISLLERHGLIDAYGRLGLVLVWLGEADESEAFLRKAIELNQHAAQLEPENVALTRKTAVFYQRLGDVSWSRGDYQAMRGHLMKAMETYRDLAKTSPSTLNQNDMMICLEQLGRLEARLERYAEAQTTYQELMAILDQRRSSGTLDPVATSFDQSTKLLLESLQYVPAIFETDELPEGLMPVTAVIVLLEKAAHFARQKDEAKAMAALEQVNLFKEKLSAAENGAIQLAIARVYSLCCDAMPDTQPDGESMDSGDLKRAQLQERGVEALEKYVAADPFNATYLGFEYEIRSLRDHPRFQRLAARFRDPQSAP